MNIFLNVFFFIDRLDRLVVKKHDDYKIILSFDDHYLVIHETSFEDS